LQECKRQETLNSKILNPERRKMLRNKKKFGVEKFNNTGGEDE